MVRRRQRTAYIPFIYVRYVYIHITHPTRLFVEFVLGVTPPYIVLVLLHVAHITTFPLLGTHCPPLHSVAFIPIVVVTLFGRYDAF